MRCSSWVLVLVVATSAGCAAPRPPRSLVLITIDTFRSDHFGRTIDGIALTPTLSKLADESVVFEDASSVASETSPGIAGIFTGLLPHRSGVVGNRHQLPESLPALAPLLRSQGFRTAAFVANPVLDAPYGFARGFETFELIRPSSGEPKARAGAVLSAASRWLASQSRTEPIFLWIHLLEPHGPYSPPPDAVEGLRLDAFEGERAVPVCPPDNNSGYGCVPSYQVPRERRAAHDSSDAPESSSRPAAQDARDYELRYAAEIRDLDRHLGSWLSDEASGLLDRSILVLTADHGEALAGDHGFYFAHGLPLSQDQIRVPLLLRAPGVTPRKVRSPVSTVGVLATVASLLGIPAPDECDGSDLLGPPPRTIVGLGRHDEFLRMGELTLRRTTVEAHSTSLFDLLADPDERTDLAASRPREVERLMALLNRVRSLPALAVAAKRPASGANRAEELRSLGYL